MQFTKQEQATIEAAIISAGKTLSYGDMLKVIRDQRLQQTDWTQLADVELTAEKLAEWTEYRKALRNVTKQEDFPANVVWPTKPQ